MNLFWPPCWSFYDYKSLHQPEWAVAISCSRQAGVIIDGFRKHDATSKTT